MTRGGASVEETHNRRPPGLSYAFSVPPYTMGGAGGDLSATRRYKTVCAKATEQVCGRSGSREESILGWGRTGAEVLARTVSCTNLLSASLKSIDPLSVHTGDSFCSPLHTHHIPRTA